MARGPTEVYDRRVSSESAFFNTLLAVVVDRAVFDRRRVLSIQAALTA